jgi:CDP-paratose 2-epimerase
MYGRRQFATYDQGWIGWYCAKSLEMKESDSPECTVSGNGKQVRDVLHADDLIQVYAKAVQNIGRTSGKTYNIGGGMENSLSLLELFQVLEEWTGNKMRYRLLDWRQGDQKVFVADNTKANDDMGWFPSIPKEDGLRRMAEWSSSIF